MVFELLLHAAHAHVLAAPTATLAEHSGHAAVAGEKNVPTHQLNLVGGTNEVYNRWAANAAAPWGQMRGVPGGGAVQGATACRGSGC